MTAYKFKKIIPLILLLSLSAEVGYSREPRKLNYIFGGGGEPAGEKTIFDGDLKLFANFVNKSDWENTISFNGGHSKTEEIINSTMSKARNVGDFNEVNYNKMIDEMIQKIESGELAQGDQLMINIDTHGAKRGKNELTHSIAVSRSTATDLRTLSGSRTVNLDRMEKLAALAADKGVKLAIIDVSCFSGNLLNIKNDKTCMISATGRDQYGYAGTMQVMFFNMKFTFSGKFVDQFKKGRNLEEMFLKARLAADYTPDYPMISTPEGAEVDAKIYKMISPYLNYNEKTTNDFSKQYSKSPEVFEEQVCKINKNHNDIKNFLKDFENVTHVTDEINKNEFTELRKALEDYRNYQLKYEESLRNTFTVIQEIKDILNRDFPNQAKELLETYNPTDLLLVDFDSTLKAYQELYDNAPAGYSKNLWNKILTNVKKQKEAVEHLRAALSPEAKSKLDAHKEVYSKSDVTKGLANKIATETKKVYATLYKQVKKSESNPCRDFVL